MKQTLVKVSLAAAVLLAVGVMVSRMQGVLPASAAAYRAPVVATPVIADPLPARSQRVVLVILSGLSDFFWTADEMPVLRQLQETGAHATLTAAPPTYRLAAWTALLSGATPPLTDAPLFDVSDTAARQTATDTIFDAAADRLLTTALAGNDRWAALIPPGMVARTAFFGGYAADADAQVMAEMAQWVDDPNVSLIVAQFSQIDAAAAGGTETQAYQTALNRVDAQLAELRRMLDLDTTTLIVTADYGQLAQGGHGGDDPAVVSLPLVMVGQGVIPGEYSAVSQTDVAPTVAALLGTRLPAANQGRPLLEMLAISDIDRAAVWRIVAQQRNALVEQYAAALDEPYTPPENLSNLDTFWADKNYAGVAQLASLLTARTNNELSRLRQTSQAAARRTRLAIALAVGVALVGFALWRRSPVWVESVLSAAVTVFGYHILYRLLKEPYSLSAVNSLLLFRQQIAYLTIAALTAGVLIFAALLLLRQSARWDEILLGGYELVLWATGGFGATVLWGYWHIGEQITDFFPDVSVFFQYLTGLWQVQWVIGAGLFMPFLGLLLTIGVRKLSAGVSRIMSRGNTS